MSKGIRQGETVFLALIGTFSTATSVELKDANGNARVLLSYERLIIDEIHVMVASGVTNADLFVTADNDTDPDIDIARFPAGFSQLHVPGEGIALSLGAVPQVAQSSSAAFALGGSGRIVNGKSQGTYPNWRAGTAPGQTVGRNF